MLSSLARPAVSQCISLEPPAPLQLIEIASELREIYERMLSSSTGSVSTKGTCLFASILVGQLVAKFTDFETILQGGDGAGDGGFRDAQGKLQSHYWVFAKHLGEPTGWFVDITADQFGSLPVQVLSSSGSSPYFPGAQEIVDAHIADFDLSPYVE